MHVYYMNMDVYICVIHTVYDILVKYVKMARIKLHRATLMLPFPKPC